MKFSIDTRTSELAALLPEPSDDDRRGTAQVHRQRSRVRSVVGRVRVGAAIERVAHVIDRCDQRVVARRRSGDATFGSCVTRQSVALKRCPSGFRNC